MFCHTQNMVWYGMAWYGTKNQDKESERDKMFLQVWCEGILACDPKLWNLLPKSIHYIEKTVDLNKPKLF